MQTVHRSKNGSFSDGQRQPQFAPVKVGEELQVVIDGVGEKGDGFCRKDGFVIFVPNVQKGDNVTIKVNKVLRKVGFAEVVGQGSAPKAQAAPKDEEPAEENSDEF